jgi:hypothetical protein
VLFVAGEKSCRDLPTHFRGSITPDAIETLARLFFDFFFHNTQQVSKMRALTLL